MCEFLQRDCFLNYPKYLSSLSFLLFECNSNARFRMVAYLIDRWASKLSIKFQLSVIWCPVFQRSYFIKSIFYFLYFSETVIFMVNW